MLGVSLVTTAWSVLRLRMEETASSCEYIELSGRGQPTGGGPPCLGVGHGANNAPS
jgi:hypothetical protein